MFLAMGVGAFSAGIFHVMTHAFFKALLFLGAGSVIHAMHDEQDIRKMGGLKEALPVTSRTFLIAGVAIAGVPPFAGFFSKDEILWKAFAGGHGILWLIGLAGAALTAFYIFRLHTLTFEGGKRWEGEKHPHESPALMTVPLILLAALSVIGGFAGVPGSLGGSNAIGQWLDPVFARAEAKLALAPHDGATAEYLLMGLSVAVALAGVYIGRLWYLKKKSVPSALAGKAPGVYNLLWNKYYVDEIYEATVVRPTVAGSTKLLWKIIDTGLIDGLVNGSASATAWIARKARVVQTGAAQSYVFVFLIGVVVIIGWLLGK